MEISVYMKLQSKLIEDEKMNRIQAAITAADIMNHYTEEVKTAVCEWVDGKDVTAFTVEDVSVQDIMEEINCTPFQALGILNATKVNPDSFADAVFVLWEDTIL